MSSSKLATPTSLMHRAREGGLKGTSAKLRAPNLPDALRTGGGPNDIEVTNDPPQGGAPWKERPRPEAQHRQATGTSELPKSLLAQNSWKAKQERAVTTYRDPSRAGQRNETAAYKQADRSLNVSSAPNPLHQAIQPSNMIM